MSGQHKQPGLWFRYDVFDSPAFRSLGPLARCVYLELLRRVGLDNNGWIKRTRRQLAADCNTTSQPAIKAAVEELCRKGLIIQTHLADQTAPGHVKAKEKGNVTRFMLTSHPYYAQKLGGKRERIEPLGSYMSWQWEDEFSPRDSIEDRARKLDMSDLAAKIRPPCMPKGEQEGYKMTGDEYHPPVEMEKVRAKLAEPAPPPEPEPDPLPPRAPKPKPDLKIERIVIVPSDKAGQLVMKKALNASGICIGEKYCLGDEVPKVGDVSDIPF